MLHLFKTNARDCVVWTCLVMAADLLDLDPAESVARFSSRASQDPLLNAHRLEATKRQQEEDHKRVCWDEIL